MKYFPVFMALMMVTVFIIGIAMVSSSGIKIGVDQCDHSKVQAICKEIK